MRVYLDILKKAAESPGSSSSSPKMGAMRGGKYVAREQIGQNPDGSPRYKYFKTREDYQKFLNARARGDQHKKGPREPKDAKDKDVPFPRITVSRGSKGDDDGDKEKDTSDKKQPLLVARKSLNFDIQYFYDVKDEL